MAASSAAVTPRVARTTGLHSWPVQWNGRFMWYWRPPRASLFGDTPIPDEHVDAFAMFRRQVSLDSALAVAPCRVTADGRYVLWVNGREVARGPVRSEPGTLFWDEIDLAPHLHAGDNVLALLVRHYGVPTPWWVPVKPYSDLGRGAVLLEADGLDAFNSGASWRVMRGPWSHGQRLVFGAPNERVDARSLPTGWREAGFDDSAWAPAEVLGMEVHWGASGNPPPSAPFTLIERSPLPPPLDRAIDARPLHRAVSVADFGSPARSILPVDPVFAEGAVCEVAPGDVTLPVAVTVSEAVVFDYGRMVVGLPQVSIDAPAGVGITLRSGEELDGGGVSDPFRFWAHRHTSSGGEQLVEPFEVAGMRYLSVAADGPATITAVRLRERRYDFTDDGSFRCDDAGLNLVWQLGRRTLELCSTDAYLDCPAREQRAWLGDFYVHAMVNYAASADVRLAARALRLAARTVRPDGLLGMIAAGDFSRHVLTITDFSLHWVRALCRYWEHTGDVELVDELLPVTHGILQWYRRYIDGGVLQALPGWIFVDWWPLMGEHPLATLQGLLALAAEDHARMAHAVDQPRVARQSEAVAGELREGFTRYISGAGRIVEDVESGITTQHAAAMAVLIGAVEGDAAQQVLEAVADDGTLRYPVESPEAPHGWALPDDWDSRRHVLAAQPFFCHWLHQAFAAAGRTDLILRSVRRWQAYADSGDEAIAEFWPGRSTRGSHAHAWSATPTYDLSAHVLGVRPLTPGYGRVAVAPWFGPLSTLQGTVPTPHGSISVELQRDSRGVRGSIRLPKGVSGTLRVTGDAAPVELRPGLNAVS